MVRAHEDVGCAMNSTSLSLDFLVASANPDDPDAAQNFVQLGKTYEALQKRINSGKSVGGSNALDPDGEDDDEDYDEAAARSTYSGAGGPLLTREMRRELKRVSEEMASGGVRDGGMFMMAQMYGNDDGMKDLAGGPDLNRPMVALADGRKPRRQRK